MDDISIVVKRLRKTSFYLFLIPTIALLGSIIFNNIFVNFHFDPGPKYSSKIFPIEVLCNEENDYCKKIISKNTRFDECKLTYEEIFQVDNKRYKPAEFKREYYENEKIDALPKEKIKESQITLIVNQLDKPKENCILYSPISHSLYKIFPQPFYFIKNLKENIKYTAATSSSVNPLIYGETSISNIVKRFPINYFFKPLLYISSILMLLYWSYYQKVFTIITRDKRINKFFIFGVISSIFLFLHVLFLGMEIESKIFQKLRKIIIIIFLIGELFAQFYLVRKIYLLRDTLLKFTNKNILQLKIIFVSIIIVFSFIILTLMMFIDFSSSMNNIIEWDYFLILLFFYLLSSLMWKKNIIN
jgi:hypothetical protein